LISAFWLSGMSWAYWLPEATVESSCSYRLIICRALSLYRRPPRRSGSNSTVKTPELLITCSCRAPPIRPV
jgi:hypothetical protein